MLAMFVASPVIELIIWLGLEACLGGGSDTLWATVGDHVSGSCVRQQLGWDT